MDALICHENGLGCFVNKMVWVDLPQKWMGCFVKALWGGVGLGLGPLVSFLLTSRSVVLNTFIRHGRIEDFVILDAHVNNNERVLKLSSKVA